LFLSKGTAVFLLLCSTVTAYGSDALQQLAEIKQANQDMIAKRFPQTCSEYAKIYAETNQFHGLDPRIIAGAHFDQGGASFEPILAKLVSEKQYAHACSVAYVLVLEYVHEGNAQAEARTAQTALEMQAHMIGAAAEAPTPAPAPSAPAANPTPAPAAPAARAPADEAQASPGRAHGVSNWSQVDGNYVCYFWGNTGGSHYVGGFLWPNTGLVDAGIGLTISSNDGYSSNKGGAGTFTFTPTVPGPVEADSLGTIVFATGSLKGRKALLQTHTQFKHAIIFPSKWKMADGRSDAFSPADTWCYQKH
jgi:hypothetical protein